MKRKKEATENKPQSALPGSPHCHEASHVILFYFFLLFLDRILSLVRSAEKPRHRLARVARCPVSPVSREATASGFLQHLLRIGSPRGDSP